jgi:hypothetical protein
MAERLESVKGFTMDTLAGLMDGLEYVLTVLEEVGEGRGPGMRGTSN